MTGPRYDIDTKDDLRREIERLNKQLDTPPWRELDAARAEVERLRAIVEAAKALAHFIDDEMDVCDGGDHAWVPWTHTARLGDLADAVTAALSPSTPLVDPSGVGE